MQEHMCEDEDGVDMRPADSLNPRSGMSVSGSCISVRGPKSANCAHSAATSSSISMSVSM